MTKTEIERLAVVESKIDTIESVVNRMENKLDDAISCKADKTEVESIVATQVEHDRAISRLAGGLALVVVGIPVFLYLIERAFK